MQNCPPFKPLLNPPELSFLSVSHLSVKNCLFLSVSHRSLGEMPLTGLVTFCQNCHFSSLFVSFELLLTVSSTHSQPGVLGGYAHGVLGGYAHGVLGRGREAYTPEMIIIVSFDRNRAPGRLDLLPGWRERDGKEEKRTEKREGMRHKQAISPLKVKKLTESVKSDDSAHSVSSWHLSQPRSGSFHTSEEKAAGTLKFYKRDKKVRNRP